jgi:hypothetical protein
MFQLLKDSIISADCFPHAKTSKKAAKLLRAQLFVANQKTTA